MKSQERWAKVLENLLGDQDHVRIERPGFMPLVAERIQDGRGKLVALAHYGEQNGDAMRDPEVVFLVRDGWAEPVSIRQDFMGTGEVEAYRWEGGKPTHSYPARVKDLRSFCGTWFRNLKAQGFLD
jgi:hypothetical protein